MGLAILLTLVFVFLPGAIWDHKNSHIWVVFAYCLGYFLAWFDNALFSGK